MRGSSIPFLEAILKNKINKCFVSVFLASLSLFMSPLAAVAADSPLVSPELDPEKASFNDYVKALGLKTILGNEDARTYSSDLGSIVGSYFYVDDDNTLVRIGRPDAIPKATSIQLKDKIEFQAATEDGGDISATLPWLSFLFKKETKTSVLMQDIASVIGTSDPKIIKDNLPTGIAPAGKAVWFITGATVTVISATTYSSQNINGSSIIQVGGSKIYSKNSLQNAWIISLNKVRASNGQGILNDPLAGKVVRIKKTKKAK